jgi:hypothetical protein
VGEHLFMVVVMFSTSLLRTLRDTVRRMSVPSLVM